MKLKIWRLTGKVESGDKRGGMECTGMWYEDGRLSKMGDWWNGEVIRREKKN